LICVFCGSRQRPRGGGREKQICSSHGQTPLPLLLRTEEAGGDNTGVPVRLTLGQTRHTKVTPWEEQEEMEEEMADIWMRHVTNMNVSRRTHEGVRSYM